NCFATEPDSKIVCGVFGMLNSRSASPNAFSKTVSPLSDTAAAQPGAGATYALASFSNARSAPATTFSLLGTSLLGTWAQVAVARNTTTAKTNKEVFLVIEFFHLWALQTWSALTLQPPQPGCPAGDPGVSAL